MKKLKPRKKDPRFQTLEPATVYENGIPTPEPFSDFLEAYGVHVWVYKCVSVIASNVAAVPILPYIKKKSDDSWMLNEKHDLFELLENPNPYMSRYNLFEYLAAALKLDGNGYFFLEDFGTGEIKEIWPLLPDQVEAVASKEKMISHYVYRVGGNKVTLPYQNVIHFREMNPNSFIYGQGALKAARTTVATDIFAQVWNKSFFKNSARPDTVLETEQSLDEDVRTRIISSWKQMYQGSSKAHNPALLEGGLKVNKFSESAKDMDFINLRKDLRVEILASFGVPPSVVGLLEFANYSNMEQQNKMFWNQTLMPTIKNIEDTLTLRARQITFDLNSVFQADLSRVEALKPDMKLAAETTTAFVNAGVPINQVIDALDLPFEHVEGGDVPREPRPNPFQTLSVSKHTKSQPLNEDVRLVTWKRFSLNLEKWEDKILAATAGFFRSQKARVLRKLDQHASIIISNAKALNTKTLDDAVNLIFNLSQEEDFMKKSTGKLIKGTYFDFAIKVSKRINPSFDFDLNDPEAERWIASKIIKLAQQANRFTLETITDNIRDAIGDAIAEGFSEAETIKQIADRIDAVYQFAVEGRAMRIARTEVVSAANAGSFAAMKKTGVRKKEWLSSRDEIVRDSHKDLDGVQVNIDEPFRSNTGATLLFPGDPAGPPEEIINCRCTPIAVIED